MNFKRSLSILLCLVLTVSLSVVPSITASAANEETVYVSAASGSDENSGTQSSPYQTFSKAYFSRSGANTLTVVLLDNVSVDQSFVFYDNGTKRTVVSAVSAGTTFDITAKSMIGFYMNVSFRNLKLGLQEGTIFSANGYNVIVESTVTFTNRIKAFGGGIYDTVKETNIELYGGKYLSIYAGGYSQSVSGNAKLTIGGTVNAGDGIDDTNSSTLSPCYIYGGSYNGTVGGSTEINFCGNAISKYIMGTGYNETDTIGGDIVINITGGKVMNVYGGSGGASKAAVNGDTYIYMTGGLVESLFGGCESVDMVGNALIYVGGKADVARRIFGGCYNNMSPGIFSDTWHSSRYVKGSTTVIVDDGCKIASGTELASGNSANKGLFAGSRRNGNEANEVSTLIFLNGCYEKYKDKIGDTSGWSYAFKSNHDYLVKAGKGGSVTNSKTAGTITVIPDSGKAAVIGSEEYQGSTSYKMTSAETNITFRIPSISYTVEHWINDYNGGQTLYKTETLNGILGETSAAKPLALLGYNASVTQDVISNETVVKVMYTPKAKSEFSECDINCDYNVDMLDAALLQRYLAGWSGYNAERVCLITADVNGDGKIDAADNLLLMKYIANYNPPEFGTGSDKVDKDEGWGPWI